jgi:hypothetical protein
MTTPLSANIHACGEMLSNRVHTIRGANLKQRAWWTQLRPGNFPRETEDHRDERKPPAISLYMYGVE